MKDTTIHLGDTKQAGMYDAPIAPRASKKRHFGRWIMALIVIVVGWYLWSLAAGYMSWRAVFLTNNQVYFGHFWDMPFASAITLNDVYYLEVAQPSGADQLAADAQTNPSQQLKLVRLGNEIHGPTDQMTIPMSQVLFWETLRPDSAVVAAIKSLAP